MKKLASLLTINGLVPTYGYGLCTFVLLRAPSEWLLTTRDGVLEDVLGLEDTFWSPWPWSLKSSKIAQSSARGQHYFWTVEISLENTRNLAENLQRSFFWFSKVDIAWKKIFEDLFRLKKNFEGLFSWDRLKTVFEDLFFASVSLVLGLERVCPWLWPRNFFVSLALSLVSSTPPLLTTLLNTACVIFLSV